MSTSDEKKGRAGYQLPPALIRRIKIAAAVEGVSASALVERHLTEGLDLDEEEREQQKRG